MSGEEFKRGNHLSIFTSDRGEDIGALVLALLIAIGVVLFVGR